MNSPWYPLDDDRVSDVSARMRVSTGYERLDEALRGGFLAGSTIILSAPASDEVPILERDFLTCSDEESLLICRSLSSAQAVALVGSNNLKCLVCSEKPVPASRNILPGRGIDNLTELNLRISEAVNIVKPTRVAVDIISDILLRYKALQTRKWVSELLERLSSKEITTLATINPYMHTSEEVQAVVDLFNGNLEIVERNVGSELKRSLRIRWMHGVEVADKELPILDLIPQGQAREPPAATQFPEASSWLNPPLYEKSQLELLQMLSHILDADAVHKSTQLVKGNPRFRNEDNLLSEPARTALLLKIIGHRPLITLVILHYLMGQEFPVAKTELANHLERVFGRGFSRGGFDGELDELLDLLADIGVISTADGKARVGSVELHLSPSLIPQIMSKRAVSGLDVDPVELIQTKYDKSVGKLTDYDRSSLDFKAARIIDSIVRSGGTFEEAIRALDLAISNLRPGIDKTTLQLKIYQVLRVINPEVAENYTKSYPVRLSLKTETGQSTPLTRTELSKHLIPEYLLRLYGVEYTSKSTREKAADMIYVAFYERPNQQQETAEITENVFVEELRAALFKLYQKDIEDMLNGAPSLFKNTRYHLREAQRLAGLRGHEQNMISELASATYYMLLGCLLINKILPPPSETNDLVQSTRLLESFWETLLRGEQRESTGEKLISFLNGRLEKGEERLKKHIRRVSRLLSSDKSEIKAALPTLVPPSLDFLSEFSEKL